MSKLKMLLATLVAGFSAVASAGYIHTDGNEWMILGTDGAYVAQAADVAGDMDGWTWASSSDWFFAGMDNFVLSDPEKSAFEGTCSVTYCDAWFRDAFTTFDYGYIASYNGNISGSAARWTTRPSYWSIRHPGWVGFRSAPPVPVPAAAWLFGSGLLGLVGIARRKKTV